MKAAISSNRVEAKIRKRRAPTKDRRGNSKKGPGASAKGDAPVQLKKDFFAKDGKRIIRLFSSEAELKKYERYVFLAVIIPGSPEPKTIADAAGRHIVEIRYKMKAIGAVAERSAREGLVHNHLLARWGSTLLADVVDPKFFAQMRATLLEKTKALW